MDKALLHNQVQWDSKLWNKVIFFWDKKTDWTAVNTCLELSAEEGRLSLWLALKGKEVTCSDVIISREAKELHAKYKVTDKIEYEEFETTGIPYENYFDVIIFKSILSNIGTNNNYALQEQAVNEMYKALKPGGRLLFAEKLRLPVVHGFLQKNLQQWSSKWRHLSLHEINTLLKKFSSLEVETAGFLSVFGTSGLQRDTLSAADEKLFDRLVPKQWRYIAYGIAEK